VRPGEQDGNQNSCTRDHRPFLQAEPKRLANKLFNSPAAAASRDVWGLPMSRLSDVAKEVRARGLAALAFPRSAIRRESTVRRGTGGVNVDTYSSVRRARAWRASSQRGRSGSSAYRHQRTNLP
jgi:hypothetical protein